MSLHKIPEPNLAEFEERFAKLAKKAARLKVNAPAFVIVETIRIEQPADPAWASFGLPPVRYAQVYHMVEVTGENPVLPGGWTFLGVLEHTEAGNIILAVPGANVPATYRVVPNHCDHCVKKRVRKETFVIKDEQGNVKQIGRQCISLYLPGVTPEELAKRLEYLAELGELGEPGDDYGWSGGSSPTEVRAGSLLALASALYSQFGWTSRAKSQATGQPASSGIIKTLLLGGKTEREETMQYIRKLNPEFQVTADDEQIALNVIAWCQAPEIDQTSNEYRWNLKLLTGNEWIAHKKLGMVASAVASYKRELGEQAKRTENEAKPQAWIGTVGKREVFALRYLDYRAFEGDYSCTYLITFETAEGYVVKWFASNSPKSLGMNEGETYTVKATVKKQDEYKGTKQTMLTRCNVGAKIEEQAA